MLAISSLVKALATSYPHITFAPGDTARWSSTSQTVYYDESGHQAAWTLLHETSHGLLEHSDYERDINLLKLEREAWSYALHQLAPKFGITIDPEFIEAQLDTYRDWLHAKSTCPACQSNGYEAQRHTYSCLHCGTAWHTNIGIDVGIRRYKTA